MRRFFIAFGRKLAPHTPKKFLHLVFLGSLGSLVAGCFLFNRLGPMSIILPIALTISAGLSEVDLLFCPVPQGDTRSRDRIATGRGNLARGRRGRGLSSSPVAHEQNEPEDTREAKTVRDRIPTAYFPFTLPDEPDA